MSFQVRVQRYPFTLNTMGVIWLLNTDTTEILLSNLYTLTTHKEDLASIINFQILDIFGSKCLVSDTILGIYGRKSDIPLHEFTSLKTSMCNKGIINNYMSTLWINIPHFSCFYHVSVLFKLLKS